MSEERRFEAAALVAWAAGVLEACGVDETKARAVAEVLVEGDLLGHDTHGLALLGPYLGKLATAELVGSGEVEVLSDRPGAVLWDGRKLPGPWLTREAVREASARARSQGTAAMAIRRAGHIACLAAYLEAPARAGLVVEIHSSDPAVASVAPFGGRKAVFTPNPMAFGIPTGGDPILVDISCSITTNGMSARLAAAKERFPGTWLLDGAGIPTDDPEVFAHDPPGTIQLLGGLDAGHKGYGLTLLVEALTGGLAGYGRADGVTGWGASVLVRITDPAAFGGLDGFARQVDWVAMACRTNPPVDTARPVRLPGERGLARKQRSLAAGLVLAAPVLAAVEAVASAHSAPLP